MQQPCLPQDVIGSVLDHAGPGVPEDLLDGIFLGKAVASEDLHGIAVTSTADLVAKTLAAIEYCVLGGVVERLKISAALE